MSSRSAVASLLGLLSAAVASAQVVAPGDKAPILRLEAGGPTAYVTALAFSPDGKRLYAAGFDKVVRVWVRDQRGQFRLNGVSYRIPLGPGVNGAINALAVSPDGSRLAVGGQGVYRGLAAFGQAGYGWPVVGALDLEKRRDQGTIYVFNTNDNSASLLRGHTGPIIGLAFAPPHPRKPALLVSAALDWEEKKGHYEAGLRLWDVAEGTSLARTATAEPNLALLTRPDLASWHTGDGAREVEVAFSLGDGRLGVWEADRDRLAWAKDNLKGTFLRTAWLPGPERLLTVSAGSSGAYPRLWRVDPGSDPQVDQAPDPGSAERDNLPGALAPFASQADGKLDHAAVVVRVPTRKEGAKEEFRLQILPIRKGVSDTLVLNEAIWQDTPRQPVVAVASRGRHLAVAGGPGHAILVYAIDDLLKNKLVPQRLNSAGETFRNISFGVKGRGTRASGSRGLLLSDEPKTRPGAAPLAPADASLVFDFSARRPSADREGWERDAPDVGDWRVKWSGRAARGKDETLAVAEGDKEARVVRLYPNYTLSDFALLPPRQPLGIPLLAVASHRRGQPMLVLYNARTGEPLRHCVGHTDVIAGLAFSADGRLLASAGEDQTVCVWSLTNLDRIVGRHGLLPGVAVRDDGGSIVVARVDEDSPLRESLKAKDVIEGVVEAGKLKELPRPEALYEAVDRKNPGQNITLRVRDKGDVTVKVGQGSDTRNPLLSLFLTRKTEGDERQWIGWSPLGPYDVSGQRAEALLGWHLNTGRAEAPAQFAPAGEYRRLFYRQGLLKELIARGDLPPLRRGQRDSRPEMGLVIDDNGKLPPADEGGVVAVRSDRVTLRLKIGGVAPDDLASVTWSLDGKPARAFEQIESGGRERSTALALDRGVHRVRVVVRLKDDPEEYPADEARVRYQPPPPVVKVTAPEPGKRTVVRQPEYRFRAEVRPGKSGERVLVTLRHTYRGREVLRSGPLPADGELSQKVNLQPGDNTLEVTALNRDALEGQEGEETVRQSVVVNYRKKDEAPLITLKRLAPLGGDGGRVRDLGGMGEAALVVTVPQVRIEGAITAAAPLTRAERFLDQGEEGKALAGFASGRRSFTVAEKIDLRPGEQTLRFVARTEDSDPAERSLRVEYQPQVPRLAEISPEGPVRLVAGKDRREIRISGRLAAADNEHPYRKAVLVNGKKSSVELKIVDGTFSAQVPVGNGLNRVVVELSNRWGSVSRRQVEVSYVRPPRITAWRGPEKAMTATVDLVAEVDSELPLRGDVRAEVNGDSIGSYELLRPEADAPRTWRVRLKNVLLGKKGENVVTLSVRNDEASSEPSAWRVQFEPEAPPEVAIIEPGRDGPTPLPEIKVRIRVRSASPLQTVQLVREGGEEWGRSLDPERFTKEGEHYLSPPLQVPLVEGTNVIRAEAASKGGAHKDTRRISYVPPPVVLQIDDLVPRGEKPLTPVRRDGELVFTRPVPGRVKLRGRVIWSSANEERQAKRGTVRIFVNGFQQVPAELAPPASGARFSTFERDIILNRAQANHIEVTLADLPRESGALARCTVDCSAPVRAQRLHLLIVSAQQVDPAELEKQFLKAFGARTGTEGVMEAPSFERVIVYGPLVGDRVHSAYVNDQLVRIHEEIRGHTRTPGAGNDVVVFYFKGGEVFTGEGGHVFVATGRRTPTKVVEFRRLVDLFADTPGAQVLLFDVDRDSKTEAGARGGDRVERWRDYHADAGNHLAVLRYAWLGGPRGQRDPLLLRVLQTVLPETSLLLDVTNGLQTSAEKGGSGKLLYTRRVPEELENLRVGAKP